VNPTLRHAAAHVFVPALDAPLLDEHDRHHLGRVLRLRPGASVTASDGAGRWAPFVLGGGGELEPAGPVECVERTGPELTVATAIPKGDRPELIVQKLTELGIDRVVLVDTVRSVVHWTGERGERQLERLRRVGREAAMQSRRVRLPVIEGVVDLGDLLAGCPTDLVVAEPGGRPMSSRDTAVLIGPEGGFAPHEVPAGIERVGLGETVLRVETAAIAAATLLVHGDVRRAGGH
jgi:16S rRNA (uracil1498-N3)-methyltransferase